MIAIVYIVGMLIVCAGIGSTLLRVGNIDFESSLEKFVYVTATGCMVLILFVFVLGLMGYLHIWSIWGFFGIAGVLTLRGSQAWLKQSWQGIRNRSFSAHSVMEKTLLGVLGIYVVLYLVIALAPPTMWDGIHYLFPTAQSYIRQHQIHFIPYVFTMRPKNMVMLYVTGFLLQGEILAVLWNYALTMLCGLLVYSTARQYMSKQYALMAATIFYTMPLSRMVASGSLSESGVVLYGFLAFSAFMRWWRTPHMKWIVLAGIFSGFAAGFKVIAIEVPFMVGVFILGAVWHIKQTRTLRQTCLLVGTSFCVFLIAAGMFGSLWYGLSYIWTGHPVYDGGYEDQLLIRHFPTQHSLEGEEHMKQISSLEGSHISRLSSENQINRSLLSSVKKALVLAGRFGPKDLLVHAWNLSMANDHQGHIVGPLFLLFVPLGLLGFVRKPLIVFVVYGLAYFSLGMNLWGGYNRYIIPLFPVLAIVVAEVLRNVGKSYARIGSLGQIICVIMLLIYLPETAHTALNHFPAAVGLVDRDTYFERSFPGSYQVARYVNRHLPEKVAVLVMGEYRLFLYEREVFVGGTFSTVMQYRHFNDPDEAFQRLQRLGITHVILNHQESNNSGYDDKEGYVEDFRERYLQLLYSNTGVSLYELTL